MTTIRVQREWSDNCYHIYLMLRHASFELGSPIATKVTAISTALQIANELGATVEEAEDADKANVSRRRD